MSVHIDDEIVLTMRGIVFALLSLVVICSAYFIVDLGTCNAECQQEYQTRMEAYAKQLRECGALMVKQQGSGEDGDRP